MYVIDAEFSCPLIVTMWHSGVRSLHKSAREENECEREREWERERVRQLKVYDTASGNHTKLCKRTHSRIILNERERERGRERERETGLFAWATQCMFTLKISRLSDFPSFWLFNNIWGKTIILLWLFPLWTHTRRHSHTQIDISSHPLNWEKKRNEVIAEKRNYMDSATAETRRRRRRPNAMAGAWVYWPTI